MNERRLASTAASVGLCALAAGASFFGVATEARADNGDFLGYPVGSEVRIYINWDSFEAQGIPSSWQGPFTDSVINAYTRWQHVGAMNLRPKFYGYTTATSPGAGEIVIMMNESHSPLDDRIASRFGAPALIVFHRNSAVTGTPWNFVPYRPEPGEIGMQGVLMHELGHAFGLEHEADAGAVMFGGYQWQDRYGPNENDLVDIQDLYGLRTDQDVHLRRTTDLGVSWSEQTTNLTSMGVTTTSPPAVSRDPDRTVFFYTGPGKRPSWIIGNNGGTNFDGAQWWVYGGLPSMYGSGGHGYDDEYMMTWVDYTDDDDVVRVVRSTNGGQSFGWVNPPTSSAVGTPSVHKIGDDAWVLAYARYDAGDLDATGEVVVRTTSSDGATWSDEIVLNGFYRADNSVSVTSNGSEVRIGFSWARDSTGSNFLKRTIVATWNGSELSYDRMIYESESSRTAPNMSRNSSHFLQAWREPNFDTSINTRRSTSGSTTWNDYVRAVQTSLVPPAVGAYRSWSFGFLYTLEEA